MWCSRRMSAPSLLKRQPCRSSRRDCMFPPLLLDQWLVPLLLLQASAALKIPLEIVVAAGET